MCKLAQVSCFLSVLFMLVAFSTGLYEDQIGKFDWRQQYIGLTKFWFLDASSSSNNRRIHIGSHNNVVASVNLKTGDLAWRHFMEEHGELVQMAHCGKYIASVVKHQQGMTVRVWDSNVGHLLWEDGLSTSPINAVSILCHPQSKELLVLADGTLTSYSLQDGEGLWTKTLVSSPEENLMGSQPSTGHMFILQRTGLPSLLHITELGPKGDVLANYSRELSALLTLEKNCLFMPATKNVVCLNIAGNNLQTLNLDGKSAWVSQSFVELGVPALSNPSEANEMSLQRVNDQHFLLLSGDRGDALLLAHENEKFVLRCKIPKATVYAAMSEGDTTLILTATHSQQPFRNFNVRVFQLDGKEHEKFHRTMHIAQHHAAPKSMLAYMFRKRDGQFLYRMILLTEDNAIHHLQQNGPLMWLREEALASVLTAEIVDLPVSENQAKMEEEFGHQERNVLEMFVKRITTQLSQLKAFVLHHIRSRAIQQYASTRGGSKSSANSPSNSEEEEEEPLMPIPSDSNDDELTDDNDAKVHHKTESSTADELDMTRDEFNLHKIIVTVTASGKVFGMDSYTGHLVWKYFIPNAKPFNQDRVLLFQQRTNAHFPLPPQCVLIMQDKTTEKALLFPFNPVTGLPAHGPDSAQPAVLSVPYKLDQATMLQTSVEPNFLRPILLVDKEKQVHVYPAQSDLPLEQHPVHLFTVDPMKGQLVRGYRVIAKAGPVSTTYHAELTWRLALGSSSQKITAWNMRPSTEHVHSVGRILGDRGVLYKYLNPNILAIITESVDPQSPHSTLMLYLIDVVVGKVIFSTQHKRCSSPVSLVHSEHWVVYSFYNHKSHRTEVVALELYEHEAHNARDDTLRSFMLPSWDAQYLMKHVKQRLMNWIASSDSGSDAASSSMPVFSSRARSSLQLTPQVLRQAYIIATPVRRMHVSLTEKGITAKSVLFALETGGVLELPKALLDPRRTLDMTMELREEGVEGYMPELPLSTQAIINYNQTVSSVRGIVTAPSGLESTSMVFVYGLDLFFTRIAPSKMYDMLKEDFDYTFISLVTVGMIVGSFVTQRLAANKALRRAWQ